MFQMYKNLENRNLFEHASGQNIICLLYHALAVMAAVSLLKTNVCVARLGGPTSGSRAKPPLPHRIC